MQDAQVETKRFFTPEGEMTSIGMKGKDYLTLKNLDGGLIRQWMKNTFKGGKKLRLLPIRKF